MMLGAMRQLVRVLRVVVRFCAIEGIGRILYYSGILYFIGQVRQRVGRRRLLIPMYHRVADGVVRNESLIDIGQGVPVRLFRDQLRVLRWFGPLRRLEEGLDSLYDAKSPTRTTIAVTFDDGYLDNIILALPALQECGAHATLFPVVRTASGGRGLWWDELSAIVSAGHINGTGVKRLLAGLPGFTPLADDAWLKTGSDRSTLATLLCERFVDLSETQREAGLCDLASRLQVRRDDLQADGAYASWEDLRVAHRAGCEIGGHTVDHVVLTTEDPETAQAQIGESRRALEQALGHPVRSFAYPNGRHDATVRALTAAAGFRLAVTVQAGVNYAGTDPHELRRVPIHLERPYHLALKLAFYGWVHRA
jgi:peptidoglycan/xylan/chitin deacetylase (PgdA/CDA1 family)